MTDDALVHTCSTDKSILTVSIPFVRLNNSYPSEYSLVPQWDLRKECRANCHMLREGSFLAMAQRKDHEWELISSHGPGILLQWDCDVADSVKRWDDPRGARTNALAMSPSGKYLATG